MAKLFIEADLEKRTMRVFSNKSRKQEIISTENLKSLSIEDGKLKIARKLKNGTTVLEIYTSALNIQDIFKYEGNEICSMKRKAKMESLEDD